MLAQILAALALAIWLYLLLGRGGFWLSSERDDGEPAPLRDWPKLTVVIPARDEAQGIEELCFLRAQIQWQSAQRRIFSNEHTNMIAD